MRNNKRIIMRWDATYRANIENSFEDYLKLVADLCRMSASHAEPLLATAAYPDVSGSTRFVVESAVSTSFTILRSTRLVSVPRGRVMFGPPVW